MKCKACLIDLPESSFYASNKAKCKECFKASVRANRLSKIDHYRSFDRGRANLPHRVDARLRYQQTDAFRISHAVASKRWDVANAIRKNAAVAVNNAVRDGRLLPLPCLECGAKAQAHHPDYSAPLAVSWLCSTHHAQLHKEHRERMRDAA
jgi:hypothetical protein